MFNSIVNTNHETGIRYGVIAVNSLDPDLANDLFYGPDAVDLSYQEAYEEAKAEYGTEWDNAREEAEIAAGETDPNMTDDERERFIEKHMIGAGICWTHWDKKTFEDRDEYIESRLERFSDLCQIDEPIIEGVYEGVTYHISWLGGAPLVWVFESPYVTKADLCSPCVPNAGSLDSLNPDGYECYDVPPDWRQGDGNDS